MGRDARGGFHDRTGCRRPTSRVWSTGGIDRRDILDGIGEGVVGANAALASLPAVLRRSCPADCFLWDMCNYSCIVFYISVKISQKVLMLERKWSNQEREDTWRGCYKATVL